jgi:hypothetical protein
MAEIETAKALPLSALEIIESDSLRRVIRDEIRAAKLPWWRQFANWQFVSGVIAASAIFVALIKAFAMTPMIEKMHEFVGTKLLAQHVALLTYSGMERVVQPYQITLGDDTELKFTGEVCDKTLLKSAFAKINEIARSEKIDIGCPVFSGTEEDSFVPVLGLPGQWVQVDAYVAERIQSVNLTSNCSFAEDNLANPCLSDRPTKRPSINGLRFLIEEAQVEMNAVWTGFELPTGEGTGPWSYFKGKIQIPQSDAITALHLVKFRVTYASSASQKSLFTIFGNLQVSQQKEIATPPSGLPASTKGSN